MLLLAAPVVLATLGLRPEVMGLLYPSAFAAAVPVLQWQIRGNALIVASRPLGYLLLAAGALCAFMIGEISAMLALLGVLLLALPLAGLPASRLAVASMYLFYLPYRYAVARIHAAFRWTLINRRLLVALLAACGATLLALRMLPVAGAATGIVLAAGASGLFVYGLHTAQPRPLPAVPGRVRQPAIRARRT